MNLKIVISSLTLLVAVFLPFGTALKCYTCVHNGKSPENNNCLTMKNVEPTICTQQVLKQRDENSDTTKEIRNSFSLDMVDNIQSTDWACLKVDYHGLNGMNNYTVRTCQPTNAEYCNGVQNKLKQYRIECNQCTTDACNGASSVVVTFPFLTFFIIALYYFRA
ncbi:uncharacterized protein LOC122498684 [Leptopilina heterotoma]|uniref:uncharacterized protein LOC122498684 n=1 Tax=Leptopilina heterotoma TaxID=63436 RepID=UPI001CA7C0D3|nr:uncharacterized protein LOC122498684 [Leptopilina heterotoma]